VVLGCNVQVNLDCTIGHDTVLEDEATLAPGVHVSGRVHIEQGAYIGTGAVIINGSESHFLRIGRHAVVGAGASVIRDVPAETTVVGVPALPRPRKTA
jgi:acetyltransferase-like isoleucine patch superfamily enzyme